METNKIQKQIKGGLILFITLLVISGITAFSLEWELTTLNNLSSMFPDNARLWIEKVTEGVKETNAHFPFMAYGTDWLVFAHIVIAIFFIGAIKNPVRNIWSIEAGMISCLLVFVLAFTAGTVRGIPFWWKLIDCSFGVLGFGLLWFIYLKIRKLEAITTQR
jgi:hypothetical protein